jgi:hypothetical protein
VSDLTQEEEVAVSCVLLALKKLPRNLYIEFDAMENTIIISHRTGKGVAVEAKTVRPLPRACRL